MLEDIVQGSDRLVEVFRKISGWEHYEVSNHGRVRCLHWSIGRRLFKTGQRYMKPRLCKKKGVIRIAMVTLKDVNRDWQIAISRLVLMTFRGMPQPKQEACHYPDPNPENNRLDNLCWGFKWENEQHKTEQGMKQKRLTVAQVKEMRLLFGCGWSQQMLRDKFGVTQGAVSLVVRRKSWQHIH